MIVCFVDEELLLLVSCLYICAYAQCFEEYIVYTCTLLCCFYDLACFFLPSFCICYCIWNPTRGSSFFFGKVHVYTCNCLGCAVLLCLVVCLTLLASFFSSLIHVHCIYICYPVQSVGASVYLLQSVAWQASTSEPAADLLLHHGEYRHLLHRLQRQAAAGVCVCVCYPVP